MTGSLSGDLVRKWTNADWTEEQLLDSCPHASDEDLVVIGGCARSGTTLLRVILDSHRDIIIGPPTNVFIPTKIDASDIAFRLSLELGRVQYFCACSGDRVDLIEALAVECKQVYKKGIWGEKTARNVLRFGWILDHFPRARVIHVIRDGRDVSCSLRQHRRRQVVEGVIRPLTNEMPLELCMARWVQAVNAGIEHRENSRYLEVFYEEMVKDLGATALRVCAFLGLPFDAGMLRFDDVKGPLRDPIRFPQNIEATFPLYGHSIGRWLVDLDASEKRIVEQALEPTLIKLGYA